MTEKIYIIGDIHGSLDKLKMLLEKIDWQPQKGEKLIFLGDYIDRGAHGPEVVDLILELKKKSQQQLITLCGNHEQMFLDFITGRQIPLYNANGINKTIFAYAARDSFPVAHLVFYENLKLYYETETHIFVHAGLRDNISLKDQDPNDLLWIRNDFLNSDFDHGKTVVFGHTPFRKPLIKPQKIGLDTGAIFGGQLTCLALPDNIFISV